jgi:dihydrofolate reductase
MRPKIALIVVVAPGNIIGDNNNMPWHMPRDLKLFRRITLKHPIIMGRKTFESLRCKALPNRKNIVVTRNSGYTAPGCEVAHSLKEAIDISGDVNRIFVIGGGQIYADAISLADEIYLTQIENKNPTRDLFGLFNGDTFFPEINKLEWEESRRGRLYIASNKMQTPKPKKHIGLYHRLIKYTRISKTSEIRKK